MQKVVLPNGLTILYQNKVGTPVVVEVLVKVGSNQENENERGIAHFLEHLLFEGTVKRPTNRKISNEIEKIGGDFNAYTTNERTCYYVKVLKKHFNVAVDILADIMQNSLFDEEHIKKEKNIVLKEIDMINDEPRFYQWLFLQKNLFSKHPCKNPTYGSRKVIENLTKEEIVTFFQKHYYPSNMIISVVGDVPNWRSEIKKKFVFEGRKGSKRKAIPKEPASTTNKIRKEKKEITNSYLLLGFKTIPRKNPDSEVLDVINGILGRGQSGRMFTEIRSKRGLAYDVGTQNINELTFGYFAIYATIDKKNINLVKKLILLEIEKLKKLDEKDLKEAKTFIEGDYLLNLEDFQKVGDELLFWEQVKDANIMKKYLKKIKKVSRGDVKRVINKYFNKHTMVVLEGKK